MREKNLPSRTLPEKTEAFHFTTSTQEPRWRSKKFHFNPSQPPFLRPAPGMAFSMRRRLIFTVSTCKNGSMPTQTRKLGTPQKKIGILFGWWTSEASWFFFKGIWRVLGLKWYRLIKQEIQKIPKRTPIVKPSSFGHELEGWTQKIRSPEVSKGDWLENNEIRKIKNSRYVSYRCIYIYLYIYIWFKKLPLGSDIMPVTFFSMILS